MKRRVFLASLLAVTAVPRTVAAQGVTKVVHIGWLTAQQASSLAPYVDAMRIALADLGYVEGRNLVIEFRYGDDVIERVPELAAELARLPVDLIVAQGAAAFEIRGLGLPIPIVYSMSADPVSGGFADSLAGPRGNMTGVTLMAVEFNGKRLELLQEIVPELRRVAIVGNPEHPGSHLERAFSEETARRLGLTIEYLPTRTRDELTSVLSAISAQPPQAISFTCGWLCNPEPGNHHRFRHAPPRAGHFWLADLRPERCSLHIWAAPHRVLPAVGILYRPHSQGCEARRPSHRAADKVRVCDQPEDGKGFGPDDSAVATRAR
jgi:ABC-type uncharacterized transport system substrate-binding protein